MRKSIHGHGLRLQAIAGTYVVLLGWDIEDVTLRQRLLGFAIKRNDHTENESYWLHSMKTFPGALAGLGADTSTRSHPIQSFQWGDYTAKPDHKYTYSLLPLYDQSERPERRSGAACRRSNGERRRADSLHLFQSRRHCFAGVCAALPEQETERGWRGGLHLVVAKPDGVHCRIPTFESNQRRRMRKEPPRKHKSAAPEDAEK